MLQVATRWRASARARREAAGERPALLERLGQRGQHTEVEQHGLGAGGGGPVVLPGAAGRGLPRGAGDREGIEVGVAEVGSVVCRWRTGPGRCTWEAMPRRPVASTRSRGPRSMNVSRSYRERVPGTSRQIRRTCGAPGTPSPGAAGR